MNKQLLPFLMGLFFSSSIVAQTSISYDFDNDKKLDKMILTEKDQGYIITYTLTTQKKTFTSKPITIAGQSNSIKMSKNVIVLSSQFMRGENTFKFRYDEKLKQIKLIGFDNNQYGGATNDGSGLSSYNLITGQYEANWNHFDEKKNELVPVPKLSKKYPIKNYTLNNFSDDVIDKLYNVGYELLPAYLK